MVSETDIFETCNDSTEKKSRLQFLKFVMYCVENAEFEHIRHWYTEWVRAVERGFGVGP